MKRRFKCPTCGEAHDRLVCDCWKCPNIPAICPNCGDACGKLKDGEPAPPPKPVAKVISLEAYRKEVKRRLDEEIEKTLFGED
jgi:hypothetical protein